MAYFLSLVRRDVVVVDVKEHVGTGYMLGVGGLPSADALAETAELIGVQSIPGGFVPRIVSELAMLQHIASCWVKDCQGQQVVLMQKGRAKSSKVGCFH